MNEWVGVPLVLFCLVVGMALYGHNYGFGAQCEKMFPEKEVEQMICVERRTKGDTIEEIWQTMGRGKNELH